MLLRDYQVAQVILIGGTAAISQSTQDMIAAATQASVSRLAGADRVHTAAQAATRVLGSPAAAHGGSESTAFIVVDPSRRHSARSRRAARHKRAML